MKVKALKLRDEHFGNQWYDEIEGDHWEYDQFKAAPGWRKNWISFDSVLYHAPDDRVYLGITSFDSDIFRAYDRKTGQRQERPRSGLEIISTGTDLQDFLEQKNEFQNKENKQWLPYLVVELAPYDNSLLRQIYNHPQEDPMGLFRLPTGEVIVLALQLLSVMEYLHKKHNRGLHGLETGAHLLEWD